MRWAEKGRPQSLETAVFNTPISNRSWKRGKNKREKYGRNGKQGKTKTLGFKGG